MFGFNLLEWFGLMFLFWAVTELLTCIVAIWILHMWPDDKKPRWVLESPEDFWTFPKMVKWIFTGS